MFSLNNGVYGNLFDYQEDGRDKFNGSFVFEFPSAELTCICVKKNKHLNRYSVCLHHANQHLKNLPYINYTLPGLMQSSMPY